MTNQVNKIKLAILERTNELYKVDIGLGGDAFVNSSLQFLLKFAMSSIDSWIEIRNLNSSKENVNDELIEKVVKKINKTTKENRSTQRFISKVSRSAKEIILR